MSTEIGKINSDLLNISDYDQHVTRVQKGIKGSVGPQWRINGI